jgi:hypothetical protein
MKLKKDERPTFNAQRRMIRHLAAEQRYINSIEDVRTLKDGRLICEETE